jgi:hypothetical protein
MKKLFKDFITSMATLLQPLSVTTQFSQEYFCKKLKL